MKCLNCKNLGWGEEYPGKKFFGWCKEVRDAPELDRERECEHFVQATNADRIRAMSDEELARELALIAEWDRRQLQKAKSGPGLVEFMEHWLQQPAKEDT